LRGEEVYTVEVVERPRQELTVTARADGSAAKRFTVIARLDTPVELDYYGNGGILHTVLRNMA
jgi:aconitate hydratase